MSCRYAEHDAAYLLGALEPAERADYERHLPGCVRCRAGVEELAALPGLLSRVYGDPTPPVPDTLLPGLVRRVRAERLLARWRLGAAAALAGAAAAALIVVVPGVAPEPPSGPPESAPVAMTAAPDAPVTASVRLTERGWGTSIDMLCRYDEPGGPGYGPAPSYALYAADDLGGWTQVSSWYPLAGREVEVPGATSLAREQISALEVRSATGETVLSVEF